jgi:hypothetical protein
VSAKPATVVSLGARGDISRAPEGGTSCNVREFALLSDGREVTVLEGRGWMSSARPSEIFLTDVVRNILTAVLPDDAEETGDEHEWQDFAGRLRDAGFTVTVAELRALPYQVTLEVRGGMAEWPAG